ncbi:MAG: hypothetical protein MRZ79_17550 [Bacteroidia bacterium]|nr:hypothetical protein [Bacteroidia bacterium]
MTKRTFKSPSRKRLKNTKLRQAHNRSKSRNESMNSILIRKAIEADWSE